jgi:exodeoxyribonuclease VII large subunit
MLLNKRSRYTNMVYQLEKHNPNEPLERGFARVWQNEKWIRSKASIDKSIPAQIEWSDGRIDVS